MRGITTNRKTCFYLVSAIILLIGLGSALVIYWTAENDAGSDVDYEVMGGSIYPGTGNSKKYVHDLKLYGGEAAVMADQISRWFAGLWQGRSLAYTVACITLFISLGFFFAARHSSSPSPSGDTREQHHNA